MIGSQWGSVPQRGQVHEVGSLRESHRNETPLRVSMNLVDGEPRVCEIGDAAGNDPSWMWGVPLLEDPIVPGPHTGQSDFPVLGRRKNTPAEAGDLRGEVHLRPDSAEIHVGHARVRVVATRPHLIEAKGFEFDRLRPTTGDRVHSDLGVEGALELPDLMTLGGLDQLGSRSSQGRRQIALEEVRGVRRRDHRPKGSWFSLRAVPARAGTTQGRVKRVPSVPPRRALRRRPASIESTMCSKISGQVERVRRAVANASWAPRASTRSVCPASNNSPSESNASKALRMVI